MSRPIFSCDVQVEAVPVATMPPNAEILARLYTGDLSFGLLRDPKNRALYLASVDGYFRLDVPQLLASFADALREWRREWEWLHGIGATGAFKSPRGSGADRDNSSDARGARRRVSSSGRRRRDGDRARARRAPTVHATAHDRGGKRTR